METAEKQQRPANNAKCRRLLKVVFPIREVFQPGRLQTKIMNEGAGYPGDKMC
jgi:spore cortex formation protein SpoVR/YcgB (stage V sporulation)